MWDKNVVNFPFDDIAMDLNSFEKNLLAKIN